MTVLIITTLKYLKAISNHSSCFLEQLWQISVITYFNLIRLLKATNKEFLKPQWRGACHQLLFQTLNSERLQQCGL